MTATIKASSAPNAPLDRRSRWRRIRPHAGAFGTYLLLVSVGIVFLFPFLFLVTTSLKTSEEVFRYPPQLLPMRTATTTYEGEELPLYRILVAGSAVEMVPIETDIRAGVYVDPAAADQTTLVPDDVAVAVVDELGSEVTARVDGEELPLFDVIVAGEPQRLARSRNTSVAEFVSPQCGRSSLSAPVTATRRC